MFHFSIIFYEECKKLVFTVECMIQFEADINLIDTSQSSKSVKKFLSGTCIIQHIVITFTFICCKTQICYSKLSLLQEKLHFGFFRQCFFFNPKPLLKDMTNSGTYFNIKRNELQ